MQRSASAGKAAAQQQALLELDEEVLKVIVDLLPAGVAGVVGSSTNCTFSGVVASSSSAVPKSNAARRFLLLDHTTSSRDRKRSRHSAWPYAAATSIANPWFAGTLKYPALRCPCSHSWASERPTHLRASMVPPVATCTRTSYRAAISREAVISCARRLPGGTRKFNSNTSSSALERSRRGHASPGSARAPRLEMRYLLARTSQLSRRAVCAVAAAAAGTSCAARPLAATRRAHGPLRAPGACAPCALGAHSRAFMIQQALTAYWRRAPRCPRVQPPPLHPRARRRHVRL